MQHPLERRIQLLSKGPFLTQQWSAEPGRPGTPQMYHNGLGRFFVGRSALDHENRRSIEYAPDPEGVLELAATAIRRGRFSRYTYDQDQTFPITRRLAYAAFPDVRPKNQPPVETPDERMERTVKLNIKVCIIPTEIKNKNVHFFQIVKRGINIRGLTY